MTGTDSAMPWNRLDMWCLELSSFRGLRILEVEVKAALVSPPGDWQSELDLCQSWFASGTVDTFIIIYGVFRSRWCKVNTDEVSWTRVESSGDQ